MGILAYGYHGMFRHKFTTVCFGIADVSGYFVPELNYVLACTPTGS